MPCIRSTLRIISSQHSIFQVGSGRTRVRFVSWVAVNPMKLPTGRSRRSLLSAAAVLAVLIMSPRAAQATCGDYVSTGHAPAAHSVMSDNSMPQPAAPKPCRGPFCSQSPAPLAPSTPVPASSSTEWGMTTAGLDHSQGEFPDSIPERSGLKRHHRSSDIYHPPR
jgi:hypothetical protein